MILQTLREAREASPGQAPVWPVGGLATFCSSLALALALVGGVLPLVAALNLRAFRPS